MTIPIQQNNLLMNYLLISKNPFMKTIVLILTILIILFSTSCNKIDYSYSWTQNIQNLSNHDCKLTLYTNHTFKDSLILSKSKSILILEDEDDGALAFLPFYSAKENLYSDSIVIRFDDNKVLRYSRNSLDTRNIFRKENYTENIENKNATYTYYITSQDYQNAVP